MSIKILVADDDSDLCEEISEILTGNGYSVDIAHDGLRALKYLEKKIYDLVLLDIKMPGLSGLDVLKHIRSRGIPLKVIMLSANPTINKLLGDGVDVSEASVEKDLKLADAMMSKPYDVDELLRKIENLLSVKKSSRETSHAQHF